MPLFHVGGTGYAMFGIYAGAPSTFTREPDPASLLAAFAAGTTHALVVPAGVATLLAAGRGSHTTPSRRFDLIYGAATPSPPAPSPAHSAWSALNFHPV